MLNNSQRKKIQKERERKDAYRKVCEAAIKMFGSPHKDRPMKVVVAKYQRALDKKAKQDVIQTRQAKVSRAGCVEARSKKRGQLRSQMTTVSFSSQVGWKKGSMVSKMIEKGVPEQEVCHKFFETYLKIRGGEWC